MREFKPYKLTPQQEKAWSDTRVALLWHCPAFSHIFYTLMNKVGGKHHATFTSDVPIAATDGTNLLLNPETFFKFPLNKRLFAVAHEIGHCIFNHCNIGYGFAKRGKITFQDGSELPYIPKIANMAMDYVINDMLIESKVGEFHKGGVLGPEDKGWLHDTSLGTAKDSWIDVYKKVYDQLDKAGKIIKVGVAGGGGYGVKPGTDAGQFDEHLDPGAGQGKDPGQASQERNEAQWQTEIAAAMNSARAQGKLPAGLERLFNEILNPKVDWREHIQALFARKVGSGNYDYRRPYRPLVMRDIYAPGRSGFGAGTIVVGVDTSGSIGQEELDMFFAEMTGILEDLNPKRLVVMWCDAKVHRVDQLNEAGELNDLRMAGAPGGGGTSFIPVFDRIEELGIEDCDALVYLTDGMGSFPDKQPSYPVIWGSIEEASKYPFGDVVNVPKLS